jgi:hypothetical protein
MKPGSAYGVQEATAIVGLESTNGWNKPPIELGNRISILGLWQPGERFEYALAQGGFKSQSYIKVMDWMALKAAQTLAQTGRLTVVVQDNGESAYQSVSASTVVTLAGARAIRFLSTSLLFRNESD